MCYLFFFFSFIHSLMRSQFFFLAYARWENSLRRRNFWTTNTTITTTKTHKTPAATHTTMSSVLLLEGSHLWRKKSHLHTGPHFRHSPLDSNILHSFWYAWTQFLPTKLSLANFEQSRKLSCRFLCQKQKKRGLAVVVGGACVCEDLQLTNFHSSVQGLWEPCEHVAAQIQHRQFSKFIKHVWEGNELVFTQYSNKQNHMCDNERSFYLFIYFYSCFK